MVVVLRGYGVRFRVGGNGFILAGIQDKRGECGA